MKHLFLNIRPFVVFAGTVVGAGIFGVPYVAAKAGFLLTTVYFVLLTVFSIFIHSLLGDVASHTKKVMRIPGFAGMFLGFRSKQISFLVSLLGLTGALLAYLIIGGEFLYYLLSPIAGGSVTLYTFVYFALGALLIYLGIRSIAIVEIMLLAVFLGILGLFFAKGMPFFNPEHLVMGDVRYAVLPYGIVLFSLWGTAVVPEIAELSSFSKRLTRNTIAASISFAALCSWLFGFIILSVSGAQTSENAITGFTQVIGDGIVTFAYIFGIIVTFTSFITLGLTFKQILTYDFKINERVSWMIACFLPLVLFVFGFQNFIHVLGLTGALMLGAEAVIIIFIYQKFIKRTYHRNLRWWPVLLTSLILAAVIAEMIYFFTL